MYVNCALKERYGKTGYTEYIMKNINRSIVLLEFIYLHNDKESWKSKMIEIKEETMKNVFRSLIDYNIKNYINLLSSLSDGYLIGFNEYSESQETKIIRNKENEIEAIFKINASVRYVSGLLKTRFELSINGMLISKSFLIKIAEDTKNFYVMNNESTEAIEKFILFLKESHSRFFLFPFNFRDSYYLKIRVHDYSDLSFKFTFVGWSLVDVREADNSFVDEIKFVKKSEYLEMKLENFMDIINVGKNETEKKENVKGLICTILRHILFYYLSHDELPKFEKTHSRKHNPMIGISYNYSWLENKAKKVRLLVPFLELLKTIVNMPSGYKTKDVFEGDLALITTEITRGDVTISLIIYFYLKSSYENEKGDIFLQIKVETKNFPGIVNIFVYFTSLFDEYIYMKKENLDIFINDLGNFLTRLGFFYHPNEFLFLARYAKVAQMLMP